MRLGGLKCLGVEKFRVLGWGVLGNHEFYELDEFLASPSASGYFSSESAIGKGERNELRIVGEGVKIKQKAGAF